MKLVASVIIDEQVEAGRYLGVFLDHLHDFCDDVVVVRDGEDGVDFFAHEGRARQRLLDATLERAPTHVLAIDADELVADGPGLRRTLDDRSDIPVWWLQMEEIWEAGSDRLCVREDGGWASHSIPALWRVPERLDAMWRINDRALACGRVPRPVDTFTPQLPAVTEILHFGWSNEAERDGRYQRYVVADGGRFHASEHLQSIMWPCDKVKLRPRRWPAGLAAYQPAILRQTGRAAA